MLQNKRSTFNTPPMPEVQAPLVVVPKFEQDETPNRITEIKIK